MSQTTATCPQMSAELNAKLEQARWAFVTKYAATGELKKEAIGGNEYIYLNGYRYYWTDSLSPELNRERDSYLNELYWYQFSEAARREDEAHQEYLASEEVRREIADLESLAEAEEAYHRTLRIGFIGWVRRAVQAGKNPRTCLGEYRREFGVEDPDFDPTPY